MARKCFIGVGDKAKEARSIFLGINGVAKPIKKAYIGVNGVARPCFSGVSVPDYYGAVTGFAARHRAAAVTLDDVMIIAGGQNASGASLSTAEAINKNLEHIAVPNLAGEGAGGEAIGAAAGDYAVFCTSGGSKIASVYDKNFVTSYLEGFQYHAYTYGVAAVSFNGYAMLTGSANSATRTCMFSVDKNLVVNELADLPQNRRFYATAQNWSYAIFAGGSDRPNNTTTCYANVDAYDKNLVHTAAPNLGVARQRLAGARAGNYAVFAGGAAKDPSSAFGKYKTVDAYDRKLTKTSVTDLASGMHDIKAITLGECALIAGYATADCYDNRLIKVNATAPSGDRRNSAAGVIGDYGIFIGGGSSYSGATNTADAYLA